MKRLFLPTIILFLCFLAHFSYAGRIAIEGHYQGKNLYIQNPYAGNGVGFCTNKVTINGEVTTDEVNSSAFEIDFTNFKLNIGEKVTVIIDHKNDCVPKVLNPEVLKPKSTFIITQIETSPNGMMKWSTESETGKLPFIIEQYRWNKWIKIGEVDGNGSSKNNSYKFKVSPHSGENKIRVKQIDYTGRARYSPAKTFRDPSIPAVTFSPTVIRKELTFSGSTRYELYDQYGNIVKRGTADKINFEKMKKGNYWLSYDNKTETILKK